MKKIFLFVISILLGFSVGFMSKYFLKTKPIFKEEKPKEIPLEEKVSTETITLPEIKPKESISEQPLIEKKVNGLIEKETITLEKLKEIKKEREPESDLLYKNLASIYEKMRPQKAAEVLEQMNDKEAGMVLSYMKKEIAAKVIENLDPIRAKEISKYIIK